MPDVGTSTFREIDGQPVLWFGKRPLTWTQSELKRVECHASAASTPIDKLARLRARSLITLINHEDGAVMIHGGRPGNAGWSTNGLSATDTYGLSQSR
jgi:hypothetical protein